MDLLQQFKACIQLKSFKQKIKNQNRKSQLEKTMPSLDEYFYLVFHLSKQKTLKAFNNLFIVKLKEGIDPIQ